MQYLIIAAKEEQSQLPCWLDNDAMPQYAVYFSLDKEPSLRYG
jgi:hypothetical protein